LSISAIDREKSCPDETGEYNRYFGRVVNGIRVHGIAAEIPFSEALGINDSSGRILKR